MVEVFKTNVKVYRHATLLVREIMQCFDAYEANFDLEDCDKILRVQCTEGYIQPEPLIDLLKDFGFHAEVLREHEPFLNTLHQ